MYQNSYDSSNQIFNFSIFLFSYLYGKLYLSILFQSDVLNVA